VGPLMTQHLSVLSLSRNDPSEVDAGLSPNARRPLPTTGEGLASVDSDAVEMPRPASLGALAGSDALAGEMTVGRAGRGEGLAGAGFLLIGGSFVSSTSPSLFEGLRDVVMTRIVFT
jgi:hypothetical protein